MHPDEMVSCPSCGGAGGGPFGRAGSAWDDEDYVCPRCEGRGLVRLVKDEAAASRPGVAKTSAAVPDKKRALGEN